MTISLLPLGTVRSKSTRGHACSEDMLRHSKPYAVFASAVLASLQQLIKEHGIVEESEGESDDEGEIRLVETKKEQPAAQQGQQGAAAGATLVESGIDLSVSVGMLSVLMRVGSIGLPGCGCSCWSNHWVVRAAVLGAGGAHSTFQAPFLLNNSRGFIHRLSGRLLSLVRCGGWLAGLAGAA